MSKIRFRTRTLFLAMTAIAVTLFVAMRWLEAQQIADFRELTKGQGGVCEVHQVKMSTKVVELTFGMRMDMPIDDARPKLFPHADGVFDTRACMGLPQEKGRIYVCSKCTAARLEWLGVNGDQP